MKRLVLAVSLAVIALGIGIFETVYIGRVADRTVEYVDAAVNLSKEKEDEKAGEVLEKAREYWKKNSRVMKIFLSHDKNREISENLVEMQERIGMEEIEEFYSLCAKTKGQLSSLKENELPLFENIF